MSGPRCCDKPSAQTVSRFIIAPRVPGVNLHSIAISEHGEERVVTKCPSIVLTGEPAAKRPRIALVLLLAAVAFVPLAMRDGVTGPAFSLWERTGLGCLTVKARAFPAFSNGPYRAQKSPLRETGADGYVEALQNILASQRGTSLDEEPGSSAP
jgi:hypothetical protein